MNSIIHGWATAAKIPKRVSFHTSRHTYATLHLTYGTSIEVLKELLGHKDVRETQIYAKIIDRKKVEAVRNLPELN
jgi:site-specific recombinase XerD